MRPFELRTIWLALILLAGCTQRMVVRAPVLYPAELPIRAFPSLILAGGTLPEGDLAEPLRAHLAADKLHDVRKVEVKDLEPLRKEGTISPFTLVVLLEPGFSTDGDDDYEVVPTQFCDVFYGCYTSYQVVDGQAARLVAHVDVTVYEGPTARKLQTLTLDAWQYGGDTAELRKQLMVKLGQKLARAVDFIQSETRAELEQVKELPIVGLALSRLQANQWNEGRDLLEQAARQLAGQRRKTQAKVWYDLAIARQYAPGPNGLDAAAFKGVETAFQWAIKLDGSKRYLRAYQRAKQTRERAQILEDQRKAARDNYALRASGSL